MEEPDIEMEFRKGFNEPTREMIAALEEYEIGYYIADKPLFKYDGKDIRMLTRHLKARWVKADEMPIVHMNIEEASIELRKQTRSMMAMEVANELRMRGKNTIILHSVCEAQILGEVPRGLRIRYGMVEKGELSQKASDLISPFFPYKPATGLVFFPYKPATGLVRATPTKEDMEFVLKGSIG